MKSLLITLFALQLSLFAIAQEVTRKKEAGIVFSNFNNFGATFRSGNAHALWRYSAFFLSGGNSQTSNSNYPNIETTGSNFGAIVSFGREYRKSITEKFYLRYGLDVTGGFASSKYQSRNTNTSDFTKSTSNVFNYGINFVIGGGYALSDNFLLGVELLPYIQYQNSSTNQTSSNNPANTNNSSGLSYGLSNSSALLSIVYRW